MAAASRGCPPPSPLGALQQAVVPPGGLRGECEAVAIVSPGLGHRAGVDRELAADRDAVVELYVEHVLRGAVVGVPRVSAGMGH